MRNMRLSELRKKSNKYFRNIRLNNKSSKRLVEYAVNRAYELLPPRLKKVIEDDKDKYIANSINTALQDEKGFSPYSAFRTVARALSGKTPQAMTVFRRFRQQKPHIYAKYNSYMFRNGYSASNQFYTQSTWAAKKKSVVNIVTELPDISKGVHYDILIIEFDFSSDDVIFADLS